MCVFSLIGFLAIKRSNRQTFLGSSELIVVFTDIMLRNLWEKIRLRFRSKGLLITVIRDHLLIMLYFKKEGIYLQSVIMCDWRRACVACCDITSKIWNNWVDFDFKLHRFNNIYVIVHTKYYVHFYFELQHCK